MSLVPPFELLDLEDGNSISVVVTGFEVGDVEIRPKWEGAPTSKTVQAYRLHVTLESKAWGAPYLDVTGQTTVARLGAILASTKLPAKMTFKAVGSAPDKRYEVVVEPA